MRRIEVEEMILAMADIVEENRMLRSELDKYQIKLAREDARLYGKKELVKKLDKQISENLRANLVSSCGWMSSDTYRTIDDMDDLTEDEYEFCKNR